MHWVFKRRLAIGLSLVLCLAVAGGVSSKAFAAPITLKLGTKMPNDCPEGKAFLRFAELVKEKTNGEVQVDVYPYEQLGKGTTQIDNVMLGTQDMFAEGSAFFVPFDKDFRIVNIPYLFRDYKHFQKVMTGPIGQRLNENLLKKNIRVLNVKRNFLRGPYRVLCSTKPFLSLDDAQGLKLRVHSSDVYIEAWRTLGAMTTVIPWTETYLALRQHVVDGVVSPISLVYGMKFTEVAPHVAKVDDYPQDVIIIMNDRKFGSLSEAHQKALLEAAEEAGDYGTQLVTDAVDQDIAKMKKEHGADFVDINLAPFQEKMKDFYQGLEAKEFISKGLIQEIINTK